GSRGTHAVVRWDYTTVPCNVRPILPCDIGSGSIWKPATKDFTHCTKCRSGPDLGGNYCNLLSPSERTVCGRNCTLYTREPLACRHCNAGAVCAEKSEHRHLFWSSLCRKRNSLPPSGGNP